MDFELSPKPLHSFPHSRDADSKSHGGPRALYPGWHAAALIRDFQQNRGGVLDNSDLRGRTPRMTMNVGETFLHNAKQRHLQFLGQSAKIAGHL